MLSVACESPLSLFEFTAIVVYSSLFYYDCHCNQLITLLVTQVELIFFFSTVFLSIITVVKDQPFRFSRTMRSILPVIQKLDCISGSSLIHPSDLWTAWICLINPNLPIVFFFEENQTVCIKL